MAQEVRALWLSQIIQVQVPELTSDYSRLSVTPAPEQSGSLSWPLRVLHSLNIHSGKEYKIII